ncbi:hypothetical protein BV378_34960 [Nostoc sp. RF31YmG]|nr:hypothetical protein BV378_34960 [Nostoc sp. RF31YmG]
MQNMIVNFLENNAAIAQHELLLKWNNTKFEYPEQCIHELFEAQVQRTPDAVAVVFADQKLTYSELNIRANQLAHYLQNQGVASEVLVGICMERSLEMIVGLLAILKAGGAYVPLDPAYPQERLALMLEDSQLPILLTQTELLSRLPSHQAQVVCLDSDWQTITQESQENLNSKVTPANLAYTIYTSGSTGKPKGVQIIHQAVVNFLASMKQQPGFTAEDILLAVTTISFDIAVLELFLPITVGAKVAIVSQEKAADGNQLIKLLAESGATVMQATPATWRMLIAAGWQGNQQLKILCGGEAMTRSLANQLLSRSAEVWNMYGPTETTIWSTVYRVEPGEAPILVGKPIANTQIYLINQSGEGKEQLINLVPIGEAGELLIGGVGLARGYLNRPELTNEKFIDNPFSEESDNHLYRTGDLARYLPDGNIELIGRIDNQVKIRGFRIELGDIEAALSQHPTIRAAVVLATEDNSGSKSLVAYIVTATERISNQDESDSALIRQIRTFLKEKLPEYMVPNTFVVMDKFPLTPNGKIDRRALPTPQQAKVVVAEAFVAPRNPVEQKLAEIWTQVLQLEQVGIDDNFFELGGHSLLATQVISRVRQAFCVEISLRSLFSNPTIAELAQAIAQLQTGDDQNHQPIPQLANRESIPLSFAQQRVWFLEQLEPNRSAYIITDAQRLKGKLNIEILQQCLDAIVAHHEALRTTFIPADDGNPIQVINPPRPVELKLIDLRSHPQPIEQILNQEAQRPFNLASDLMVRATLVQIDTEEQILMLAMHHIASDGWSTDIFWQQLAVLYEAFLKGKPSPLTPLPIQYADFAVWQRQYLSGTLLEAELDYWKNQLAGASTVLELPTDRPRAPIQTYRGASQSLSLSSTLSASLTALARQQGVTLFMTLLAAFGTLLHRYTGQEDILIGSPIAGRNRAEIEELIGFFINTVVLRTQFADNPSFANLLAQVREVALGAYAHQDMPFEKLVEELHVERDTSRNPLFQVWFNMLNLGDMQVELPGLVVEPVSLVEAPSKFDLTLYVLEQQEIQLELVYNADLFNAERMQEMLHQFQHLLSQIVAVPQQPISSYSLVTPASQSVLPQPSATLPQPDYELVTTAFTSWVDRNPEQTALRQGSSNWSYQELGDRATTLARAMLSTGVKPGDVVAVFGTKSFGLIATTIGVLLSGGVLLTIDPQLPSYRQELMLQAAKAKYLIYIDGEYPKASELWQSLIVISVDSQTGAVINLPQNGNQIIELPQIQADDAAYIFFTSGTTGIPKGVLGCHKGLAHFLTWQRQTFNIGQQDRVAQLTGLSFDVVLRDIFLPLISGATLCLPEAGDNLEPTKTLRFLEQEQISVLHTVPSYAQSWLVNVPEDVSLQNLRWLFFAGEPLKQTLVQQWRKAFPTSGEIINLYGPTETTLAKCYYQVPDEPTPGVQPIGLPLPQTQALVFTSHNQICGLGELGEIVIRTPFRSKGYINATAENLARFVKNPFGNDEQDWLYYTGDRGRYRPDGLLEILGRQDHQIKLRGIRIEPGEIEAVLTQHPNVFQAVVIAREDVPGDKRLVAYITPKDTAPSISDVRRFLSTKLPQYMIPSVFVLLGTLPLTPNGKVDRRALPAPELSRQELEATFVAPRNQVERQLVQIWQQVLGVESIGVRDNFFELGGHSLLAVKLFWQIEQTFGKNLPLASLFQSATIEALAQIISPEENQKQKKSLDTWSSLVAIKPNGSKPPLFLTHAIWGNVLFYRDLARYLDSEQPVYGLQARGINPQQAAVTSLTEMAANYIQEIRQVQPHGPYYLGGYSLGGLITFEIAQQLKAQGEQIALLAIFDMSAPGYSRPVANSDNSLFFHARKLLNLNIKEQLNYVWARVAWHLEIGKASSLNRFYLRYIKRSLAELRLLDVALANDQARKNYVPSIYPGKLTLLRTSEQNEGLDIDPLWGWDKLAAGVEIHYVPGAHTSVMHEPHVQVVAEKLRNCLDKVDAESTLKIEEEMARAVAVR